MVLSEVFYSAGRNEDFIEIRNLGSDPVDVVGYFLCFRVGEYAPLSALTRLDGGSNSTLAPGDIAVFSAGRDLDDEAAGLGLYRTNLDFSDPNTIVDYVRWGNGDPTDDRGSVAVSAGIWSETSPGELSFVPSATAWDSLQYLGDGSAASNPDEFVNGVPGPGQGAEEAPAAAREVVISEVFQSGGRFTDYIELENRGDRIVNLGSFVFCLRVGVYPSVSSLENLSEDDLIVAPGERLVVRAPEDLNEEGTIALYWRGGVFGEASAMADFVQWGAASIEGVRSDVELAAGLWAEDENGLPQFVPAAGPARSLSLVSGEDEELSTASDYEALALSFGFPNAAAELSGRRQLSPDAEVPPVQVESEARGWVAIAVWANRMAILGSYENLTSPLQPVGDVGPVHVHLAVREPTQGLQEATGPVSYVLEISEGADATSGVVYGNFDFDADTLLAADVAPSDLRLAFEQEQMYFNLHTENNPTGELRTQLGVLQDPPAAPAFDRDMVINEVFYTGDAAEDYVEIRNAGPGRVDLSGWQFCFRQGSYAALSGLQRIAGASGTVLEPGDVVAFATGVDLDDNQAGVGLYVNGSFGSSTSMVDYVQWGASNLSGSRANVALDAGLWTAPGGSIDFVPSAEAGEALLFEGRNSGVTVLESLSGDFINGVPSPGQPN